MMPAHTLLLEDTADAVWKRKEFVGRQLQQDQQVLPRSGYQGDCRKSSHGLRMKTSSKMEFDGSITYKVSLNATASALLRDFHCKFLSAVQ